MKAFHFVQWYHLDPGYFDGTPYGMLVGNASLDPVAVKTAFPHARFFGSMNTQMLPLYGPDNPYFNGLRAAMFPYILWHEGAMIPDRTYDIVFLDWRMIEGAAVYADYIVDHHSHDVYVDDMTAEAPMHRLLALPEELRAPMAAAYVLWREALLRRLRERISAPRLLIANTGGFTDPRLDGVTIEQSHIDRSQVLALARFAITFNAGALWSVDWSGRWEFPELGLAAGRIE